MVDLLEREREARAVAADGSYGLLVGLYYRDLDITVKSVT
jgi:hypothetical protein